MSVTIAGNSNLVLQVVSGTKTTSTSTSSGSWTATGLTATITPSSTNSKVFIVWDSLCTGSGSVSAEVMLYRGATQLSSSKTAWYRVAGTGFPGGMNYLDSPSTTSSTTYEVYVRSDNGATLEFNISGYFANITLMEISA
jgi:hypothetical protein